MVLLPQKAGPLTLMRKLGGDGIVESYTAILDEPAGKAVVAHRFTPFVSRDAGRMAAVESRLRDLVALRHPVLVPVLDHVVVGDDHYAVCDQVDSVDLAAVLRRCRETGVEVPRNVYLNLATQICNGLEALHSRPGTETGSASVLHMALRPSTIRLTPDGKVLVGDFGWLRSPTTVPHSGLEGDAPRMEYLAPEQTHPDQKLTPASDIFSLGAILYEMLTLRPMFLAESTLQTIHKVRRAEVTTQLLEVKEQLPGLDRVLYRALSLNPRHRYQRAFVLREDLRGLMAGFTFARIIDDTRAFLTPFLGGPSPEPIAVIDRPAPSADAGPIGAAATPLPLPPRNDSIPPVHRGEPTFLVPDFEAEEITALKRGRTLEPAEARIDRPSDTQWFTREDHETPAPPPLPETPPPAPTLAPPAEPTIVPMAETPIPLSETPAPIPIVARTLPPQPEEVTETPIVPPPAPAPPLPSDRDDTLRTSSATWLDSVDPVGAQPEVTAPAVLPADAEPPIRRKKKKKRDDEEARPLELHAFDDAASTDVRKPTPIPRPPRLDTRTATPLPSRSADFEDAWERRRPSTPVGAWVAAGLLVVAFLVCGGLLLGGGLFGMSGATAPGTQAALAIASTPAAAPTPPAPTQAVLQPVPPEPATLAPPVAPAPPAPVVPPPKPVAPAPPPPKPVAPAPKPVAPPPRPAPVVAPVPVVSAPKPAPPTPRPVVQPKHAPVVARAERTPTKPAPVVPETPPAPTSSLIDAMPQVATRAERGGLDPVERTTLEALPSGHPEYTRANALLYQDAKARGAVGSREKYLQRILTRPENKYRPEYLVEAAELDLRARRWQPALDAARTAERHWARMPSELIFAKKALIYEIQAAAHTGIFFDSEGKSTEALSAAIQGWTRYREHVSAGARTDLVGRADERLADLRAIEARLP